MNLSGRIDQGLAKNHENDAMEADCQITSAVVQIELGNTEVAARQLDLISSTVESTSSFTIHLEYEKAWSSVNARQGNWAEEQDHLQNAIAIGTRGLRTLQSGADRWHWINEVEEAYRRLLELSAEHSQLPPLINLANWELFRYLPALNARLDDHQISSFANATVASRIRGLHDATLLTFAVFRDFTLIWISDSDGVKQIRLNISSQMLQSQVKRFSRLCSDPGTLEKKVNDQGSRLYQLLIGSVEDRLDTNKTLFIESDDALANLPWPALVDQKGDFLGRKYTLVNTPGLLYSSGKLAFPRVVDRVLIASPGSLKFGDIDYPALPNTNNEASTLSKIARLETHLSGADLTISRLQKELPSATVFHFAGHSILTNGQSALLLNDRHGGELLTAQQVAKMRLNRTKLVVLAACKSSGNDDSATNPDRLVNSFLNAGSKRVVASNWLVDSSATADLIHTFYQNLSFGPDRALTVARQAFLSRRSNTHPYWWAAFQSFGTLD
jgi:CHAT domain-containing protein